MRGRAGAPFLLLFAALLGCRDQAAESWPASCEAAPSARPPNEIRIAGSGTNLAPMTRIASLYEQTHPDRRVRVSQSIGTGGAIRALVDGAIDIGLASRALTAEEQARGITAHPLARVALAPTVHEHVPRAAITTAELASIYLGRTSHWPDGIAIVAILRQPGDSAMRAIEASSPELEAAMRAARESSRALTRYTDQEVRDTLLAVPGAIGFLDVGTVGLEDLPLRSLDLDGVPPTAEMVREGRQRFVLVLSLLTRADASESVLDLVRFATSSEIVELLVTAGYAPAIPTAAGGE